MPYHPRASLSLYQNVWKYIFLKTTFSVKLRHMGTPRLIQSRGIYIKIRLATKREPSLSLQFMNRDVDGSGSELLVGKAYTEKDAGCYSVVCRLFMHIRGKSLRHRREMESTHIRRTHTYVHVHTVVTGTYIT